MTALFLGQGIINFMNLRKCLAWLEMSIQQAQRDDPNNNIMWPALQLKCKRLK